MKLNLQLVDIALMLQTALMDSHYKVCKEEGQTFKPHKHIWKDGEKKVIAQESWVVIAGSVTVTLYVLDDTIIAEEQLKAGDLSMTFNGGHNYLVTSPNTFVYEFKTGPYYGQKIDKVFLD